MQTFGQFRPTGFDSRGLGSDGREDWLVAGVIRTRDSGPLEESNFTCTLRELAKVGAKGWNEDDEADGTNGDFSVERFGHWGPGWFEIIVVRPDTEAARVAEEITDALTEYPVVDESDYSSREWDLASETWARMSVRERLEAIQRFAADSPFAARRDTLPQDPQGSLFQWLVSE